jgi:hypothetical protein
MVPSISVDDKCDTLCNGLVYTVDKYAPLVRKRHRPRKFKYNAEIADAKKLRRKHERKFLKSNLNIDKECLIQQNKVVSKLARKFKGSYYSKLIDDSANKPRALFQVLSDLTTDSRTLLPTSIKDPAEAFATFFSKKVENIVASFPVITKGTQITHFAGFQFNAFRMVELKDMEKVTIKCSSVDPAPTAFTKQIFPTILPAVRDLINGSFYNGKFPKSLKIATLVPIIKDKKADINQLKNYRPVSLLSFISKIIEKLAANQLTSYINQHNLGNPRQSAYKVGHSVETTLLALQSELLGVLDRGKAAFLVLLDMSAAFDTVNHSRLIDIMNSSYHVTGIALEWFKSYLTERSFRVRIGDTLSAKRQLRTGVPQGSVLGPLLFNIFSSGLASVFEEFEVSAYYYADDTQFFVEFNPSSNESEVEARTLLDKIFTKLTTWMLANHLKLNTDKTVVLPVTRRERQFDPIRIGSSLVEPAYEIRNLGFVFNRTLSIASHLKYIKSVTFYHLRRIVSMKHCVSFQQREILVHAFITSRLDFCNSLFYGSYQKDLKVLQSILSSVARALLCVIGDRSDSREIMFRLHWLPILARINFKLAILGFKIFNNTAPKYFLPIEVVAPSRVTRSSSAPLLTSNILVSTHRLVTYGDRSCFYSVCQVFNSLPPDLRNISDFNTFKAHLKTHLFSTSFHG